MNPVLKPNPLPANPRLLDRVEFEEEARCFYPSPFGVGGKFVL
jgi:hypothetical protein